MNTRDNIATLESANNLDLERSDVISALPNRAFSLKIAPAADTAGYEISPQLFSNYLAKLGELMTAVECTAKKNLDCINAVEKVVDILFTCRQQKKKVMWIGNGGSAAIASHAAVDYWKTGGIKSVSFNEGPLLTCISNDFGYGAVFAKPLDIFAERYDILVAISSSGQSENIVNAVQAAKLKGCKVVTLSGFKPDNRLRMAGDINFYVPSCHYGHVELVHSVLCHSFLDLFMARENGGETW